MRPVQRLNVRPRSCGGSHDGAPTQHAATADRRSIQDMSACRFRRALCLLDELAAFARMVEVAMRFFVIMLAALVVFGALIVSPFLPIWGDNAS